jgi:hypothetical protein
MIRRPIAVVLAHLASNGIARRVPIYNVCVALFKEYGMGYVACAF